MPLLGEKAVLGAADWLKVKEVLGAHGAWIATRPEDRRRQARPPRLKELVEGPAQASIEALLAKEKALEPQVKAITSVDRLAHYVRDLKLLLENFVSFHDFYSRNAPAIFQAGTLYLDQRSCELCIRSQDAAQARVAGGRSRMLPRLLRAARDAAPARR